MKLPRYLVLVLAVVMIFGVVALVGCGDDDTTTDETEDTTATEDTGATEDTSGEATDSTDEAAAMDGAPFKFGLAGPMTGQYANYGTSHKAGADIAIAELNANGGVNGGEASYTTGDDLGDPKEAVLVAQKFIDDSEITFVNGHMFSGATIAAGQNYNNASLTMVSPSATNPDISDLGEYIWRICMTDAVQGEGLANYSVNDLGMTKIAIIHDDSDYGRGLADAYEEAVIAAGGEIVGREQYTTGDADFNSQLTNIRQGEPELLFMSGYYPEGSKIAQQARALQMDAQFLGSDGYAADELIELGGAAVDGMLLSTFFDYSKDDPKVQAFVEEFKSNNDDANPDWFAANSYDVIMLVAEAARQAGSNDREAINEALGTMDTYSGISGDISFDENGDVVKPLSIVVVRDGELTTADVQPQ